MNKPDNTNPLNVPEPPTPPPPRLICDDVAGPATCFWSHDWGKWETYEQGNVHKNGRHYGSYEYQKRYCERCNKVQLNQQTLL